MLGRIQNDLTGDPPAFFVVPGLQAPFANIAHGRRTEHSLADFAGQSVPTQPCATTGM